MPGMLLVGLSTWPCDPFWGRTMAPRSSSRTTCERVLADVDADHRYCAVEILGPWMLLVFGVPCQIRCWQGTIWLSSSMAT